MFMGNAWWNATTKRTFQAAPSPFPKLPVQQLVPSMRLLWGMGLSKASAHPQEAIDFILWLYREAQQKLLASLGFPPVILNPTLQEFWQAAQRSHADAFPFFNYDGFVDIPALVPPSVVACGAGLRSVDNYEFDLIKSLISIYQGASAQTVLSTLQTKFIKSPMLATSVQC